MAYVTERISVIVYPMFIILNHLAITYVCAVRLYISFTVNNS